MRVGITMRVPRESVTMENYQTKKKEFKQASISKDDKKNKKARDEKYIWDDKTCITFEPFENKQR